MKYLNERMQKFSPRGSGNDQFGYGPKSNLETTKNDENDDCSNFIFESIFEAGAPQGSPQRFLGLERTRRAYVIGSIE